MRSPDGAWLWLLRKDWRELMAARSWWVMLVSIGPLVGVSFTSAVRAYGEASGVGGTAAGAPDALWPLDGVLVPTFSAYELAAVFLLSFVTIRIVAVDRQSGALKLQLQQPMSTFVMMGAKAVVLLAAWGLASLPLILAGALWLSYGGSLYTPEFACVFLGHLLNAAVVIGLVAAAAAGATHPSTAAILALGFTVGTWVLSFVAAVQGGIWDKIAAYTPASMLQAFQHGLVRMNLVLIECILSLAGLLLGGVWLRSGTTLRRRALASVVLAAVAGVLMTACSFVRTDLDVSQNQRNSLPAADRALLETIDAPLNIEVRLAPEDPRRFDLERHTLAKLRRVLPKLTVRYVSSTSIGLFEQANSHYGEIWYDLGGSRRTSRITSTEGVLETIYGLAGREPPHGEEPGPRGHPLAARPTRAGLVFYGVWPAAVILAFVFIHRRQR